MKDVLDMSLSNAKCHVVYIVMFHVQISLTELVTLRYSAKNLENDSTVLLLILSDIRSKFCCNWQKKRMSQFFENGNFYITVITKMFPLFLGTLP